MAWRALGWCGIPYHQALTLPQTGAGEADPPERERRPELLGRTKETAQRGQPGQRSGTAEKQIRGGRVPSQGSMAGTGQGWDQDPT